MVVRIVGIQEDPNMITVVIVNASARPPRLAGLPNAGTCNYRYTGIQVRYIDTVICLLHTQENPRSPTRDAQVGPRKLVAKMFGASVRTLGLGFRLAG